MTKSSDKASSGGKKRISLVLGSGGARGMAHIGVIRELEAQGCEIASIAGSSIGALIGGIFAAGKLDDYEDWLSGITKLDIFNLLDFAWGRRGLVKGDRIINALVDLVGDRQIEDLAMPYTAVATNIGNGREVWISSGRLFDAIRASISLPLFFTPFEYKGMHLIDGGVVNPVPIAPTFSDHTDMTIAVNLGGAPTDRIEPSDTPAPTRTGTSRVGQWVNRLVGEVKDRITSDDEAAEEWGAYDVANQAFDAMQGTIARQKLAAYPPDMVIEIPRNYCTVLEFDRSAELIEFGRQKTRDALEARDKQAPGARLST